jgi:phosphate starvation-inducible protein PhoH and related proteins
MKQEFTLKGSDEARQLFGDHDYNLHALKEALKVEILARGDTLLVSGSSKNVEKASKILQHLIDIIDEGKIIKRQDVDYLIRTAKESTEVDISALADDKIKVVSKKQFVYPKTKGQKTYVDAMKKHDVVVAIGPAGTGKTYLAVAMAVYALCNNHVNRIILTRPAIEAGEKLGFLPGDLHDKVTPYVRPLYDALYEMMEPDRIHKHIESGVIEVAPLAYMRGRTLNNSFIIMDEAQNSTKEQMKMFLTRLGFDSKVVITGDVTQSDLPNADSSGLMHIQSILKAIKGIEFIQLTDHDVVRHSLVQQIIKAYAKESSKNKNR